MASAIRSTLQFSPSQRQQIDPYLPASKKPHVTLTFATSLDSNITLTPGVETPLSGPDSKSMTYYLRSKHDAIIIGAGTAIADDPSLNSRIEGVGGYGGQGLEGQPRPVVLDLRGRWDVSATSKVVKLAREGKGKAPWVFVGAAVAEEKRKTIEEAGGKFVVFEDKNVDSLVERLDWRDIISELSKEGITSVMIEGGGVVINELLSPRYFDLLDTVIVTIAPTWLGKNGVQVCPDERFAGGVKIPVGKLKDVKWVPLGEDVVLCGRPNIDRG